MTTAMKRTIKAWFILVALCLVQTKATVTIVETGERFSSRPARLVGTKFREGFEYMSRLQYLHHNLELCPPDQPTPANYNYTVTVPSDGLPVALLARKGGCSYETKARFASYSVGPPYVVRYLIIYDDNDKFSHNFPMEEEEEQVLAPSEEPHPLLRRLTSAWRKRRESRDDDIDLKVLLVSHKSGIEMLRTIQMPEHMAAGGPRIVMDGRSWTPLQRNVMFWMGLSLLLSACMCSFFMSMQINRFNENFDDTGGHVRVVRRRLTVQEVATLLPETEYIGNGTEQSFPLVARAEESQDTVSPDDASTPILSFFHQSHQGDCSICLDDYVHGDKIRSLPCGHGFHSACITKWLTERSSTCPLCKAILECDSDSDDDDSLASSGSVVELREGGTQTDHDHDEDTLTAGDMYHSLVDSLRRSRRRSSRWWRRRWQSRPLFQVQASAGIDETTSSQHQQPLLEHVEGEMIETVERS